MVKKQITLAVPDIGNEELEEINYFTFANFLNKPISICLLSFL